MEGVGQEVNIRPIAVRDAGLTPCVRVNLVRPGGSVVKSVDLQFNQAATTANGPDVWDNGAGTSVNVPSGANLYAQTILLHEYGIYTQVARSNPLVLRIQPPLIVSAAQVERFLDALQSTCAEWALISECAETILSKSAGEMGPR